MKRNKIILTALLFIFVLFFNSCDDKFKPSQTNINTTESPNQESWNSTVTFSDSGKTRAILTAGHISVFKNKNYTLIDSGAIVDFYKNGEKVSTLTGRSGKVDDVTKNIEIYDSVVVVNSEGSELKTQKLKWEQQTQRVSSDVFVSIKTPNETIEGIGSNINSGFFNTAVVPFNKSKPVEFNFNFSLRFFGSFFPESSRSFDLSYIDSVDVGGGVLREVQYSVTNAPTIIGSTDAAIATGYFTDNNEPAPPQELIGGVINSSVVPLFFPQFQFGTIYGTDAVIRFLPKINVGEFGRFNFFGFAIRHNLDHYFANSPINFAIQAGYQINNIDDNTDFRILKGTDFFINLQASRSFSSLFNLYGGLQFEKYKGDINYTYVQDATTEIPVSFSQTADDKFRLILGGNLAVGYFNFNLDANISNRITLSLGTGVGF